MRTFWSFSSIFCKFQICNLVKLRFGDITSRDFVRFETSNLSFEVLANLSFKIYVEVIFKAFLDQGENNMIGKDFNGKFSINFLSFHNKFFFLGNV